MNNIEQIQCHTRLPIRFNQKQSESLLEKVNFLIHFLESYDYRGAGAEIKNLESRIRDAAYAAEDIIETHVVDTIHAHSRSRMEENEMMIMMKSNLSSLEKVVENLDSITDSAMKLKDRNETQDLHPTNPITDPSISYVPAGKNTTMVGFDDELEQITDRLLAHEPSRQVIPVVGMGGMGKTTLAKTAYEKPFIGKHFDICAWVTISQEYDLKKIMLGLLHSESSEMSDNELGQMLHKRLYGRRYLVVLDDVWSVKAWEMVNVFLPDTNNGSRIIVTTRESSVSTCFGSSSLEMSFLDEDESWNLFCEKVFAAKGCPFELEKVGRKIVKNCKGLPLSIVVIGGLLAKSERGKEYWEYIARDTKTIINLADNEQCMKILSLSYHNLPVHLKPCFLYLAAFSEDETICASMLIKLWVAEGFLKSNCSKELEMLGREYLNDLVNRNLVMVIARRRNGKIRHFMMHDLIRDICSKGAENEKFMFARKLCYLDDVQLIGSQRRFSFHKSVLNKESFSSGKFDTMRSGSMTRTLIANEEHREVLPLQNVRLLRVLNHNCTYVSVGTKYLPNDILKLVNSRLISIHIEKDKDFITSSLYLLWNLQILIVTGSYNSRLTAPLDVWKMTELRHLQFRNGFYLPDPPPRQHGLDVMKNLHTLKFVVDFSLSDEVVKRIPNIKKLEFCCKLEEEGLKNLGLLKNLESLDLSDTNDTVSNPLPNLSFPNSLMKLCLRDCRFHWEDMWIIGLLPHLEVLKLRYDAFIGPKWVLNEEVFQCLKYLQIYSCKDLVQWIAEDTHFPCLEHLYLRSLDKLVEIPSGIGDIPTLQSITIMKCSESAVISAKNILEEQENLGNVSLKVDVRCYYRYDELLSLASDNFSVEL